MQIHDCVVHFHMEMLKEFEPKQNLRDLGLDLKGFTEKINTEHFLEEM